MGSIFDGRGLVALVVDEPDDPRARRAAQIGPAPVRAVEGDVELVGVGGLAQRALEELPALLDGQAVVVGVPDDVRPAEVPRLERRGDGELVFELGERDDALDRGSIA